MTFNQLKRGYQNVFSPSLEAIPPQQKLFRITPSSYFTSVTPENRRVRDSDRIVLYVEVQGEGLHTDLNEEKFLVAIKNVGIYQFSRPNETPVSSAPFLDAYQKEIHATRGAKSISINNALEIGYQSATPYAETPQMQSYSQLPDRDMKKPMLAMHGSINQFHQRSPSASISQTALKIKQRLVHKSQKEYSIYGLSAVGRQSAGFGPERPSVSVSNIGEHLQEVLLEPAKSRAAQPAPPLVQHRRNTSETGISAKASKKSGVSPTAEIKIMKFSFKRVLFELETPLQLQEFLRLIPENSRKGIELQRELFVSLVKQTRPVLPNESTDQQLSVWKEFAREKGHHIFSELCKAAGPSGEAHPDSPSYMLLHLLKQFVIQQSFAVLNSNCSSPKLLGGNSSFKRKNNLLLSFASIEDTIGSIYEKRKQRKREHVSGVATQPSCPQRNIIRAGPSLAVSGVGGALINPSTCSPRSKLNCGNDSELGLNEILESVLIGVFTCILNDPRKIEVFYSTVNEKQASSLQLEYGSLIEKSLKFIAKECNNSLGLEADSITPDEIRNRLKSLEEIQQFRALETFKISGDISTLVNLLFASKPTESGPLLNTADKSSKAIRSNRHLEGHSLGEVQAKAMYSNEFMEGTPRSLAGREVEQMKSPIYPSSVSASGHLKPEGSFEQRHNPKLAHQGSFAKHRQTSGQLEQMAVPIIQEQKFREYEASSPQEILRSPDKKKYQSNGDFGKLTSGSMWMQPHVKPNTGLGGSPRETEKSQMISASLDKGDKSIKLSEPKDHQNGDDSSPYRRPGAGPYNTSKTPQPTMPALQKHNLDQGSNKKYPSMNFAGTNSEKKKPEPAAFVPVAQVLVKQKHEEYSSGRDILRKGRFMASRLLAIPNTSIHQQKRKESDEIQLDDMEEEIYACHFDEKWHVLRNDLKDSLLLRTKYEEVAQDPNLYSQILVLLKDENPRIIQILVKLHLGKADGRELAIAVFKEQHKIDAGITSEYSYRGRSNLDFHYEVFKTLLSQFASFKLIAFTKRLKLLYLHEDKFVLGAYEAAAQALFLSNISKRKREIFLREFGENLELMVDLMEEDKNPDRFKMLEVPKRANIWNTAKDEEEALIDLEEKLTADQIYGLKKYIYFNNSGTLHNQYYKYRRQKISLDELLIRIDSLSCLYVYRRG